MAGSRTSNLPGEGLRPPRRVSNTLPAACGTAAESRHGSSSAPSFFRRASRFFGASAAVERTGVAANRHRSGVLVVCSHRSRPDHKYRRSWRITTTDSRLEWFAPMAFFPLTASGDSQWTMGPPLMRRNILGVGLLWQSLPAAVESAGVSRLFSRAPPRSRLGCRPSEEIYCVRALEPVRGGCNLTILILPRHAAS
jgi:hypothetical protein